MTLNGGIKMPSLLADPSDSPPVGKLFFYFVGAELRYKDSAGTVYVLGTGITPEEVQDIVGVMMTPTSSLDLIYDDALDQVRGTVLPAGVDHNALLNYVANRHIDHSAVSISAGTGLTGGGDITTTRTLSIANTGVTAATYQSPTTVTSFTVNAQGQITATTNNFIAIPSTQVTDFNEAAQDAVGGILTDSSSVDFTYSDGGNSIQAFVIPGGVNHNGLLNYVANQHVDHSTVSISAGAGLTGGGAITTSQTISMPNVGTAGTYKSVTTDAQGRVTAGTNPTTLAGYGITDAQPLDADLTAVAGLATQGLIVRTGAGTATTRTVAAGTGITVTNADGIGGNPTVAITNSGVVAGSYGNNANAPQLAVNAQGQITSIVNSPISISSLSVTDFTEAAQDAVGSSLTDSASVDFTYNDVANTITAAVLPAGVDHNSLANLTTGNPHTQYQLASSALTVGATPPPLQNLTDAATAGSSSVAARADHTHGFNTTGVTPSTYGSAASVGQFTVNSQGQITAAANVSVTPAAIGAQPFDADLSAIAALGANGILVRTAPGGAAVRTIAAGAGISVANGDAVAGSPTISIQSSGVSANSYGSASSVATFTVDVLGRLTAAASTAISIVSSQVSDFAATVRSTLLTGYTVGANVAVAATDTLLAAIGKLQGQIDQLIADGDVWTEVATTGDLLTSSNATFTNVTELAFTATAGRTYWCEYTVIFRTAATTTGIGLSVGTTDTAAGTVSLQVNMPIANDGTAALYTGSITSFADVVTSTGVQTAQPTWFIANMKGVFICTTSGTVVPQFRSEVNGSNVNFGTGSVALIREFA